MFLHRMEGFGGLVACKQIVLSLVSIIPKAVSREARRIYATQSQGTTFINTVESAWKSFCDKRPQGASLVFDDPTFMFAYPTPLFMSPPF